ncbi:MAG TPA: hypothetical protein VIP46_10880, partial [Pyrinomonadaceae bacterium]
MTERPLRLWPGVVVAALQLVGLFVLPLIMPEWAIIGMLGGAVGALLILVWWAFFSRARRIERVGAILLIVVGLAATRLVLHQSVAGAGMGFLFYVYGLTSASIALVAGVIVGLRLPDRARRAVAAAAILIGCAGWALVRTGGISGDGDSDLAWRWSQTPEERLLAQAGGGPAANPSTPASPPSTS